MRALSGVLVALVCLAAAGSAAGWSYAGHREIAKRAAQRMPGEWATFLADHAEMLDLAAVYPDAVKRSAPVVVCCLLPCAAGVLPLPSLALVTRTATLMPSLSPVYFLPDDIPLTVRSKMYDIEAPRHFDDADVPHETIDVAVGSANYTLGVVPWAVLNATANLTMALEDLVADENNVTVHDAVYAFGILSHYLADASQPLVGLHWRSDAILCCETRAGRQASRRRGKYMALVTPSPARFHRFNSPLCRSFDGSTQRSTTTAS